MSALITRRQFILGAGVAGAGLLAGCGRLPWQAQEPVRVPRVGYVSMHAPEFAQDFEQGLREHGYRPGETIVIDYRFLESEGQVDQAVSEMVRVPVDVILTSSTPMTLAAKQATSSIPIVFTQSGDPVGTGLVASLAKPGGNVTGVANLGNRLASKRLELLKDTVLTPARVAVIFSANNPNTAGELAETTEAAQMMGVQLQPLGLHRPEEFESTFEAAALEHVDAISILGDVLMNNHLPGLAELALKFRLPAMYSSRAFPAAGGLMAYGPSLNQQFHRAAYYVDRILKGTKPADLPVEQPMVFEFVVNLKTARELGITFPNEIMLQVTEIIQ